VPDGDAAAISSVEQTQLLGFPGAFGFFATI
jgi:hypothetical protein